MTTRVSSRRAIGALIAVGSLALVGLAFFPDWPYSAGAGFWRSMIAVAGVRLLPVGFRLLWRPTSSPGSTQALSR